MRGQSWTNSIVRSAAVEDGSLISAFHGDAYRAMGRWLVRTLSAGLLLATSQVAVADQAPLLSIPGQSGVSSSGAATYSIPISVPPGTAGMAPSLSLNYSSQSGNGVVGLGWSVSGISAIARCPRTPAQDGVHGSVNFDSNDRFCFEGQRLVAVSGTYGGNNTEYRTEIESSTKVVSYGAAGSGPQYFRVWTKSGQIIEFGNTTDSRQLTTTGSGTVRVWWLNKVSDRKTNYYTVTYQNDTTNGQVYPTRIDYTGNTNVSQPPYNSVQFTYSTSRADVETLYHAGSYTRTTALLTNVQTFAGSSLVLDYRLAYEAGTPTRVSHLTQLQLCDPSSNCLTPTAIAWQGTRDTISVTPITYGGTISTRHFGDFNGDGITDYLFPNTGVTLDGSGVYHASVTQMLGSNSGTFTSTTMPVTYSGQGPAVGDPAIMGTLDITGDGTSDFYLVQNYQVGSVPNNGPVILALAWVMRNNGDQTATGASVITSSTNFDPYNCCNTNLYNVLGDFNGDGRVEYIGSISNGDGTFSGGGMQGDPTTYQAWDFDGDGCTDIMRQSPTDNTVTFSCNPAVASTSGVYLAGAKLVFADFNGDGLEDILVVPESGSGTLYFSTGTGFVASNYAVPTSWAGAANATTSATSVHAILTGDWNSDGKADLAEVTATAITFYLSTGNGFTAAVTVSTNGSGSSVADWNNDGVPDVLVGDTIYQLSYTPDFVSSISNGIGATTSITYDRLNKNGSLYKKCSNGTYACGDAYPIKAVDGPAYVVSQSRISEGVNTYAANYSYTGYKVGLTRINSLGFSRITQTDAQTGIVTNTNYGQGYPLTGRVLSVTRKLGNVTLSSATNTYSYTYKGTGTDGVARTLVTLTQVVTTQNDADGTSMPGSTTISTYDGYGNPLTANTTDTDSSTTNVTNTYTNDTTNWMLGLLTSAQVQRTVGSQSVTRTSCFQYESGTGLLTREIIEPVSASNCTVSSSGVQTDYTYSPNFGVRLTSTVSGSDIATRTTSVGYDTRRQFQTSATNALSQSETWGYDNRFGWPTIHTGPNGIPTTWSYDTFGRLLLETRADGNKTATSYAYCSGVNGGTASCVPNGAFIATSTPQTSAGVQNGPQSIAYYDSISRNIAGDAQGFDGAWIRAATQYDAYGRVAQTSRPYFVSGGTPKWTVYNTYDALGRITQLTLPNGRVDKYRYCGLTSSVTIDYDTKNQTTTTTRNAQGLTSTVEQGTGVGTACHPTHVITSTGYHYDPVGNLQTVTDPSGNVTSNTFTTRGFKITSSDPDMGNWSYGYDVLGELTSQTDAKIQTTTLGYDVLGRVTSRTESGQYSSWSYGGSIADHNVGKLTRAKACTTPACTTVLSDKTYAYDSLARPRTATTAVGGTNYTYTDSYDSNGNLSTVSRPSGFITLNVYTALGYLSQIRDNGTGSAYWTANTRDAELHLLAQTYGNGVAQNNTFDANTGLLKNVRAGAGDNIANFDYDYDKLGNLTYRANGYQTVFEYACYDDLNRLKEYAVGNGVTQCSSSQNHKLMDYDALGNIISKPGVGTYAYPAGGQARPHAVSSITGTVNGFINPTYTYDANGNMTAGAGRTVTYTSFNVAASIVQASTTVSFTYDAGHARATMTSPSGTTTYLSDPASGAMSEKVVSGSTTTWHDYLTADGRIVVEKVSGGTTAVRYIVTDHLGSVAVVTNEAGVVQERNAYDAWGRRRNANGSDDTTCALTSQTARGYTGHEQIAGECLINANARIYDATLGRFMTADSIVPDPYDLQSFNRYAYVDNNPLSMTDPTGHDPWASLDWNLWPARQAALAASMNQFIALGITTSLGAIQANTQSIWNSFHPGSINMPSINWESNFSGVSGGIGNTSPSTTTSGSWSPPGDGELETVTETGTRDPFSAFNYLGIDTNSSTIANCPGCYQVAGGAGEAWLLRKQQILRENKARGDAKEVRTLNEYLRRGYRVQRWVSFWDPKTRQSSVMDLVAVKSGEPYIFVECKTGCSRLSEQQIAVMAAMQNGTAMPYGPNAERAGLLPWVSLNDQRKNIGGWVPIIDTEP